ncbi:hypothetical protein SNARM312S_02731 [Streptomyces narbonensis]
MSPNGRHSRALTTACRRWRLGAIGQGSPLRRTPRPLPRRRHPRRHTHPARPMVDKTPPGRWSGAGYRPGAEVLTSAKVFQRVTSASSCAMKNRRRGGRQGAPATQVDLHPVPVGALQSRGRPQLDAPVLLRQRQVPGPDRFERRELDPVDSLIVHLDPLAIGLHGHRLEAPLVVRKVLLVRRLAHQAPQRRPIGQRMGVQEQVGGESPGGGHADVHGAGDHAEVVASVLELGQRRDLGLLELVGSAGCRGVLSSRSLPHRGQNETEKQQKYLQTARSGPAGTDHRPTIPRPAARDAVRCADAQAVPPKRPRSGGAAPRSGRCPPGQRRWDAGRTPVGCRVSLRTVAAGSRAGAVRRRSAGDSVRASAHCLDAR